MINKDLGGLHCSYEGPTEAATDENPFFKIMEERHETAQVSASEQYYTSPAVVSPSHVPELTTTLAP